MTQDLGGAATPPLISVIVRSMDRPTLDQALLSVAGQSWPALEVVVVNAKGAGHRPLPSGCGPFELRMVQPGGPLGRSAAANAGLKAARGHWICFLDDDDWFDPGHLESLARRLLERPDLVAAYAGVRCLEALPSGDGFVEVSRYNLPYDPARLLCENYLPIHSVLFSAEKARVGASFDLALAIFEDWDFWIQLSRIGPFSHVDQVSASYRLGSGDSGLYGNTVLQEKYAHLILGKWLPRWQQADAAALWQLGRAGLQRQAAQQLALDQVRAEIPELRHQLEAAQTQLDAAARGQRRLEDALRGVTAEYEQAMALLRREQFTVLRPIARHLKRAVRPLWVKLPQPLQRALRRLLARPVQAWKSDAALAGGAAPVMTPAQWGEALAGGTPGAFTVLVFPVIDWHFRIQRPQQLARELARLGHRVLYLSTTFANGPASATRLLGSPVDNVHLLQLALPGAPPNLYQDTLTPLQAAQLAGTLAELQRTAGLGRLVSLVNLPFWRPVATALPANLVVYDCMDYHAGFSTNTGRMLDEELALLQDCDLLLTSSSRLAQLMRAKAPDKPHALIRNGAEIDHFAAAPALLKLQRDGRPVVGYFGAISEWFDIQLLAAAARARPGWRFVLVGSTSGCDTAPARRLANVEFVGEVPYAELPGWVHAFDVCTIPFLINELTRCTNPVKVYEYLSAGKPVVATRLPELEAIADQVYLATDSSQFVAQIEQALDDNRDQPGAAARLQWARNHSWQSRALALTEAVADCLPPVSVVVLCFNNLALTQACLESVERHSLWPKLELVVVDNASDDGTPDFLRRFAASRPWVKLVLNPANLGFAAGNNSGLDAASGELLVLLNNDTEVSPGWIQGLWRHLQRDPGLGLVGPVTNNIGNEAKIDIGYSDPSDMPAWAATRIARYAGQQTDCRALAFFCVALRREVFAQVGRLDEAFGLGFFEDDDYCNRARAAGWRLAIAEDVFVHHQLSASFDQLKASSRQALFENNRAIYENKWGPWIPHQYREAKPGE